MALPTVQGASTRVSHPPWRPEAEQGFADEGVLRNGTEKARIVGEGPVVPHHEDVTLGDRNRPERARLGRSPDAYSIYDVGFFQRLTVQDELAVAYGYPISRQPDDALYEGSAPPSGSRKRTMSPRSGSSRS